MLQALLSLGGQVENHRIDAYVDNKALVDVWERQGGRDVRFNKIVKSFNFSCNKLFYWLKFWVDFVSIDL